MNVFLHRINLILINKQVLFYLLAITVALGLFLRIWGIDFALPNLGRPDENHVADAVILRIFQSFVEGNPTLNPKFFYYPSFYIYVTLIVDTLYYWWGSLTGVFNSPQELIDLYRNDWTSFLLLQRYITAFFGTITIPVVYLLAKNVLKSRWGGLLSAFALAVCYLHVRDSHFGVTDITGTFWVTLTLYLVSQYWKNRTFKTCLWAATCAGVSASTKYPFGLVMLAVLAVEFLVQKQIHSKVFSKQFLTNAAKIIGLTFLLFFVVSPYILLDFNQFMEHFTSQIATHKSNPALLERGFTYHLKFSLWHGLGFSGLIAAITGMFFAIRNKVSIHWVLIGFSVLFYLVIGFNHYLFVRYILPVVPVLCVYIAWFVIHMAYKVTGAKQSSLRLTSLVLLILVLTPTIYNVLWFDNLIAKKDTRSQAREWLLKNLNDGDGVGIGLMFSHIDLPLKYDKYFLDQLSIAGRTQFNPNLRNPKAQYTKMPVARHEFYISTYRDVETLRKLGIKYITVGLINMPLYRIPQQEFVGISEHPQLKQVKRFGIYQKEIQTNALIPVKQHVTQEGDYDPLDAFFVPYAPDPKVTRPGPEIQVFEVL